MKNNTVTNNCCGKKCSQCGECCGPFLPLTYKEIKRIKKVIKDYNLTFDIKDYIKDDSIHMQCPFLDMKSRLCKLHAINPVLKPDVCKKFMCNLDELTIHNNKVYFDNRAEVNGFSGKFIPMDLIFYNSPMFLLLYATRELKCDTPAKLDKFLRDTGNKEVADAIKDGRIKLEWSDK